MITVDPMEGSIFALQKVGARAGQGNVDVGTPHRPHRPLTYSVGSSITCSSSFRSSSIGAMRK